jgi:TPR repeat protein
MNQSSRSLGARARRTQRVRKTRSGNSALKFETFVLEPKPQSAEIKAKPSRPATPVAPAVAKAPSTTPKAKPSKPATPVAAGVAKAPSTSSARSKKTKWLLSAGAMLLLALGLYGPIKTCLAKRAEKACEALPIGPAKVNACQKACEANRARGCNDLGAMYQNGTGVEKKDQKRAVELYQKACDGGNMLGCKDLGSEYQFGIGVDKVNMKRAVELYQKACDGDDPIGCDDLGACYEAGRGAKQNVAWALELYKKAGRLRVPLPLSGLAGLRHRDVSPNQQRSMARMSKAKSAEPAPVGTLTEYQP